MCLIDWVGNVMMITHWLVGCLGLGLVFVWCLFGGGCEAVLVRKRPRDCG
jgi:hypothetical protein